jgi:hypothetical protein
MKNLIESYLQELFFKPNRVRKHFNYKYRQLFFDSLSYMSQELDDIVRIKMKLKENDYDAEGLNKKTRIKIYKECKLEFDKIFKERSIKFKKNLPKIKESLKELIVACKSLEKVDKYYCSPEQIKGYLKALKLPDNLVIKSFIKIDYYKGISDDYNTKAEKVCMLFLGNDIRMYRHLYWEY